MAAHADWGRGQRRDAGLLRATLLVPVIAACALAAFSLAMRGRWGGHLGVLWVDDLGQLVCALCAGVTAAWAATRTAGPMRRSWIAVSIGASSWALGQVTWCYYELVLHRATPVPSLADAGYLVFPVAAAVSLWVFPSLEGAAARRRWLFDGAIMVTAVVSVSWTTTLGAIAHAGGDSTFAFVVSLAYPVGDILILTMALSGVCRSSSYRTQLILLSAAMSAMAVADSGFTYFIATGHYATGSPVDIGWAASFLLLAVAAAHSANASPAGSARDGESKPTTPSVGRPAAATMLPYIPLLVAGLVIASRRVQGHQIDAVQTVTLSVALVLVLVRQYSTVRENRRLLDAVAAREVALHEQAFQDRLTGLANRALFIDRVQHALDLHRRDLRPLAVLFCDLDDFKTVNDTMGHGAGDALLVRIGERMRGTLRPGDTLARLGGDEFAVLLEDGGEPAMVAGRLADSLRNPFTIAEVPITIRVSIGITELQAEQPTPTLDDLLAQADIAMYEAKRAGKGQLALYDARMTVPFADDLHLRQPLTRAITDRVLGVAYQPIVNMETGQVWGFEALARWTHNWQPISPAQFIPIASRGDLLGPLTDHMMDRACAQLAVWTAMVGHHNLCAGVNVPPSLITDLAFPARVARVIDKYRLARGQLVLEITEDALLDNLQDAKVVTSRLRDLGALLSLDDFGRGYSSLLHLQQIPLDSVKIDQGFVTNIDRDPAAERFTGALLALGRDLGLAVVAEGVERSSQAQVLRRLRCPFAQGFLFSRPGTPEEVQPYVLGQRPAFYMVEPADGPLPKPRAGRSLTEGILPRR
jgi:diguanylate cyclase (GGDEF)-like protein